MMNSRDKLTAVAFAVGAVLAAATAAVVVANRKAIHSKLLELKGEFVAGSRAKMDGMSEEVAMKTAKLTHNPKINQEWVERQWGTI